MTFSRENFEEYVFDYINGKMSAEQASLFLEFLKKHPELEEEVMSIRDMKLSAEPMDYPAKNELFKLHSSGQDKILDNSFEEATIAYYEGDLDNKQKQDLEILVKNNDAFRYPFEAFSKTFLNPDETIEFKGKSSLKRLTITQKRSRIFSIVSAAAAVVILLILFINPSMDDVQPTIVQEQGMERETIRLPEVDPIPAQLLSGEFSESLVASLVSQPASEMIPENRPDLSLPLLAMNNPLIPNNIKSEDIVLPTVNKEEFVNTEFLTLGDFAREKLFSRVFSLGNNNRQENNTFWNLAMNGIEGLSNLTDGDIYVDREINQEGKVEKFTFETSVFGISAPARND